MRAGKYSAEQLDIEEASVLEATRLRADGFDVRDQDIARLSPFVRHHVNMLGR